MVETHCNLINLTRIFGMGCAVAIIVMSILRFTTLSASSIQQFILTAHFM